MSSNHTINNSTKSTNLTKSTNSTKRTNLTKNVNKITESPNNFVSNNSKCNETLKVNFKSEKKNNNKEKLPDNSEGKMACIIS